MEDSIFLAGMVQLSEFHMDLMLMIIAFHRIPVPMKSFKIASLNTDAEGSPPPPPAPADPSGTYQFQKGLFSDPY